MSNITEIDLQKLLQIALQSLTIQRTLFENRAAELYQELPSLERDHELEDIDRRLLLLKKDYEHYLSFVNPDEAFNLEEYYGGL